MRNTLTTTRPSRRAAGRASTQRHALVVEELQDALNVTFRLYRDTHLAHFNVRGPSFPQLHALFEAQYTELWAATDTIAERIRAVGHLVTHKSMALPDSELPQATEEMLAFLAASHSAATLAWGQLFEAAEASGDNVTADLCTQRMAVHQKHAWTIGATAEPV